MTRVPRGTVTGTPSILSVIVACAPLSAMPHPAATKVGFIRAS